MKPTLKTTSTDITAAILRGAFGLLPSLGGLIAEAVDQIIPNQKIDRVCKFLQLLDSNVARLDSDLQNIKNHLKNEHGLDLFEEGIVQAARAVSDERRRRLANLLAKSFSREDLKYAESKKMLNLLRDLTDPELLFLVYYAEPPVMGSEFHKQLSEKHPEILQQAAVELGSTQEEIDLGALQDSYKNTLLRLGLLRERGRMLEIAPLGELLLRYIENTDKEDAVSACS